MAVRSDAKMAAMETEIEDVESSFNSVEFQQRPQHQGNDEQHHNDAGGRHQDEHAGNAEWFARSIHMNNITLTPSGPRDRTQALQAPLRLLSPSTSYRLSVTVLGFPLASLQAEIQV